MKEDAPKESKYIRELKKQIGKLKRENASLKKTNNRLRDAADAEYDDEPDAEVEAVPENPNKEKYFCPLCEVEVIVFPLVGVPYYRCPTGCGKGKLSTIK